MQHCSCLLAPALVLFHFQIIPNEHSNPKGLESIRKSKKKIEELVKGIDTLSGELNFKIVLPPF